MAKNDKIQLSDLTPKQRLELLGQASVPKRHKYGVSSREERTCDGIVFDSKREMERYCELKVLESAGTIQRLELQVPYELHSKGGELISTYVADFVYLEGSRIIVEDCKGMRTAMYRLKRKWMLAEYGVTIRET